MKKFLFLTTTLLSFFIVACTTPAPEPEVSQIEDNNSATISINQSQVGPNQQFVIQGVDFPADQIIIIFFADSLTNLGPAVAQAVSSPQGDFQLELLAPTAWPGANFKGETRLLVIAETQDRSALAHTPIVIQYDNALTRFKNDMAGYAIDIPADWGTTDPQLTPLGDVILLGPEPIYPGNPSNSMIISVDLEMLDRAGAAQSLICGSPACIDDVVFNREIINGIEGSSVLVGSETTAELEWFFIENEGKLIYFTLHDPVTLETISPLVQSFNFIERVSNEVVAVASNELQNEEDEASPEPTSTPEPTPTSKQEIDEPTATAEIEIEPTESPTPILQPTNTPVNSPTPTVTPLTPTPTVELDLADPTTVGPLQTSLDLLTILSVSAENQETLNYLSELVREEMDDPDEIQSFLALTSKPFAFQAERIQGVVPPVVRVYVQSYINGPTEIVDFEMVLEEGRWRINSARYIGVE